jgi:hypothetical protein
MTSTRQVLLDRMDQRIAQALQLGRLQDVERLQRLRAKIAGMSEGHTVH